MVDTNTFLPYDRYVSDIHLFTFTFSPFSSIIYFIIHLFLRRHVIFPTSGRRKNQLPEPLFHSCRNCFFHNCQNCFFHNCRDRFFHNCRDTPIQLPGQLLFFGEKCCIFASSMKLIDGALWRTGVSYPAQEGCPWETKLFTKKERKKEMKKETWKTILQVIVTVLTALCTSLGVTSCMQYM